MEQRAKFVQPSVTVQVMPRRYVDNGFGAGGGFRFGMGNSASSRFQQSFFTHRHPETSSLRPLP